MAEIGEDAARTDPASASAPPAHRAIRAWCLIGAGCSAAAVLTLEVVLTRLFAVAQFYHFAFLAVSLGLLGFGASGSVLAVAPRLGAGGPRRWSILAALQAVATVGAHTVSNAVPFDSNADGSDKRDSRNPEIPAEPGDSHARLALRGLPVESTFPCQANIGAPCP